MKFDPSNTIPNSSECPSTDILKKSSISDSRQKQIDTIKQIIFCDRFLVENNGGDPSKVPELPKHLLELVQDSE